MLTDRFKIQSNYGIDFYTSLCSVTSSEMEEWCSSLMISPHSNLPNQFPFHFEDGHQITFPLAMTFNNFQTCSNDIKILYPITSVGSSAYLWVLPFGSSKLFITSKCIWHCQEFTKTTYLLLFQEVYSFLYYFPKILFNFLYFYGGKLLIDSLAWFIVSFTNRH